MDQQDMEDDDMGEDGYSYGDEEDGPCPNNMGGMGGMDGMNGMDDMGGMDEPYNDEEEDESP